MDELEKEVEEVSTNKKLVLSVSKTKTWTSCKAKYKFQYIEKLPQKEFLFLKIGKFVHKCLETFHKHYIDGKEGDYVSVMEYAIEDALKEFTLTDEENIECRQYMNNYISLLNKEKPDYIKSILAVEKPFEIPVCEDIGVIGFIDRIQLDSDNILHVVDYKTSNSDKYLKNDWFQLLTYAYHLYLEDPTIKKVRGSYVMIKQNFKYITKEFNLDEILKVKDSYDEYGKKIKEEKLFRANPTRLCDYCSYLANCDSGKNFINRTKQFGEISW